MNALDPVIRQLFFCNPIALNQWLPEFIKFANTVSKSKIVLDDHHSQKIATVLNQVSPYILSSGSWEIKSQFLLSTYSIYAVNRSKRFSVLAPTIAHLFHETLDSLPPDRKLFGKLYDAAFQINWQQMIDFKTTAIFLSANVVTPAGRFIEKNFKKHSPTRRDPKNINIAYVIGDYTTLASNANGRSMHSIIAGHMQQKADDVHIHALIHGKTTETDLTALRELGVNATKVEYRSTDDLISKVYEIFEERRIDVMLSELFTSKYISLIEARLAVLQIHLPTGFHPLLLNEVDAFFVVDVMKEAALSAGVPAEKIYTYQYCLLDRYLLKDRPEAEVARTRKQLIPPGCNLVLGTLCRLEKVTIEFLNLAKEILEFIPNACLVIAGPNDPLFIKEYFSGSSLTDRVLLPGSIDSHLYLRIFDIYLETFPFLQGMSIVEAIAYGLPVIHMKHSGDEGYIRQRDPELVVTNNKEYLEMVALLCQDESFYKARQETALEMARDWSNVEASAKKIEGHIRTLLEASNSNVAEPT